MNTDRDSNNEDLSCTFENIISAPARNTLIEGKVGFKKSNKSFIWMIYIHENSKEKEYQIKKLRIVGR